MIQIFVSGEMPNLDVSWRNIKWQGGTTLSQAVTIIGNTEEESWESMLSTSNLQLQKTTFCQTQTCLHKIRINILTVDITIDHLHLAFTTKSIWTQGHTLFQQSTLRTARVPHSLPVGDRWGTRKCNSSPQFYSKCAYSELWQMCFFPAVSRKSESMNSSCGNRSQAQRTNLTVFPDAG